MGSKTLNTELVRRPTEPVSDLSALVVHVEFSSSQALLFFEKKKPFKTPFRRTHPKLFTPGSQLQLHPALLLGMGRLGETSLGVWGLQFGS